MDKKIIARIMFAGEREGLGTRLGLQTDYNRHTGVTSTLKLVSSHLRSWSYTTSISALACPLRLNIEVTPV